MKTIINNSIKIQKRENLEGKKEEILTIQCSICNEKVKGLTKNNKCLICLLNTLNQNKNRSFSYLIIESYNKMSVL